MPDQIVRRQGIRRQIVRVIFRADHIEDKDV